MKQVDLSIYKDYKQYLNLFDVIIKENAKNIDRFLEDINISPSSYRRAKNSHSKIGEKIVKELCKHFNYNICDNELIDEVEEHINRTYFSIYYKKTNNYDDELAWIDQMINKNYIIYPILKLFKLVIILNLPKSPSNLIVEYHTLYEKLKEYFNFYNDGLKELLEIAEVIFQEDIDDVFLAKKFQNKQVYYTLCTKCMIKGRYIESIYFGNLIKDILIKDENYKRVYYVNLTLMASYNGLFRFEKTYELGKKQMLSLESINDTDFAYITTRKHFIIACIGLKKYDEILGMLKDKEKYNLTETTCLIISTYFTNKKEYDSLFLKIHENVNKKDSKKYLDILNKILKNNDKQLIDQLQNYNINKILIKVLKKMLN